MKAVEGRARTKERPALYHIGTLWKLSKPAKFYPEVETANGNFVLSDESIEVDEIVGAGNGVGAPGVKFSERHSTMGLLMLVMRMMSLDDFKFEEGYRGRHRIIGQRIGFKKTGLAAQLLREFIFQADLFQYSRRYTWITGPNCQTCGREPIDLVAGYEGPFARIGPIQLRSFLAVRNLTDPDHPYPETIEVNRDDPKYQEILENGKARYNHPRFAWAHVYEAPLVKRGIKGSFCYNFIKLFVRGKYNPLRTAVQKLDRF